MFDNGDGLPTQADRISDGVQFRRGVTVEDSIEPVVVLQALGGAVLVLAEGDDADPGTALDLDEPDLDEVFGSSGCGRRGNQVEAAVLGLDALDLPASRLLVSARPLDRDPLDLVVADHRGQGGTRPLGVRHDPGPTQVGDVADDEWRSISRSRRRVSSRLLSSSRCCSACAISPSSPGTVCPSIWRLR